MSNLYGPIVSASDLEGAVIEQLRTWLPAYLREAERRTERDAGQLPNIRTFATTNEFQKWPEDQLPACIVISPGTTEAPKMDGEGTYRSIWMVGLALVVSTRDRKSTNEVAKLYGAYARAALLQHQRLPGLDVLGVDWNAERYDRVRTEDTRTIAAANLIFNIEVRETVNERLGPAEPPPEPVGDMPGVERVEFTVQAKE